MNTIPFADLPNLLGGHICGELPCGTLVSSISISSAECNENSLFIAIKGSSVDGHQFVDDAFACGAAAAVVTEESVLRGRPGIVVSDTAKIVSFLASKFYREPSNKLKVVGITGTNGKTTTHWIIHQLFNNLGYPCARLGTLGFNSVNSCFDTGMTTPDPISMQRLLNEAVQTGNQVISMEVSSHALSQGRVDAVNFDVGIFTNLTRDHLDYHGDFESYYCAKRRLFEIMSSSSKNGTAVVNIENPYGLRLTKEIPKNLKILTYGRHTEADIQIQDSKQSIHGSRVTISLKSGQSCEIQSGFIGEHNFENLAAAVGAALACGIGIEDVGTALAKTEQVPGRLQRVSGESSVFGVYVDYAHTPDALERVLRAIGQLKPKRLIVLFGCGGNRDRGKRKLMRKVATGSADLVYVTSDNPRNEAPEKIVADIMEDASQSELSSITILVDRRDAIRAAVGELAAGDILLIAGKGHEEYQIIAGHKYDFSDVCEAKKAIEERN